MVEEYVNGTLVLREADEGNGGMMEVLIGIMIGLLSSIAINIGQNIQSLGAKEPGADIAPCTSKKWRAGLSIFITGSIGNMVAMAFASATILVPLESSQFVTNVFFSRFVNHNEVSCRQWLGTWVAVMGTVITCAFGPNDARCFSLEVLESFWFNPIWLLYVLVTFSLSGLGWLVYFRLVASIEAQGAKAEGGMAQAALPALFAVSSALVGGAQMIVHSKALAEVFDMLFRGTITFVELLTSWFFWAELVITAACGIFWAVQMNSAITLYDPLFIIPLLQASYITFGSTASGIFYQEFETLANTQFGCLNSTLTANGTVVDGDGFCWRVGALTWLFYISGIVMVVTGIMLLAPPGALAACCGGKSLSTTELLRPPVDGDPMLGRSMSILALGWNKQTSDLSALRATNGGLQMSSPPSFIPMHSRDVLGLGGSRQAAASGLSTVSSDGGYAAGGGRAASNGHQLPGGYTRESDDSLRSPPDAGRPFANSRHEHAAVI